MIPLQFNKSKGKGLKILCLGAHCDDIEIGCGGTILKLIEEYAIDEIKWVVFASNETRKKEAMNCANLFLEKVEKKDIQVHAYRDAFLPYSAVEIKENFEAIKADFDPDLVFTHYRNDRHQDHRLISDLSWNTFRSHFILEYEIPKYDGDLGIPNCFCGLTSSMVELKIDHLIEAFKSQHAKHWFEPETFRSFMRIRGLESAGRYAEAFHVRKIFI